MKTASFGKLLCKEKGFEEQKKEEKEGHRYWFLAIRCYQGAEMQCSSGVPEPAENKGPFTHANKVPQMKKI